MNGPDEATVETAARALAREASPKEHGQLCPIWFRREKEPEITECDCWVLGDARRDARVVLSAVWPT